MTTPPHTSLEIERKYEVSAGTEVVNLSGCASVATMRMQSVDQLDATYFDTAAFALAQHASALRLRLGGKDSGWHLKTRTSAGMQETHWNVDGLSELVPAHIAEHVNPLTGAHELRPIARIQTERTSYVLEDAEGVAVAELADDLVVTTDLTQVSTSSPGKTRSWREWEVELVATMSTAEADQFFAEIEQRLVVAGAKLASFSSKIQRALGKG